VIVHLNGQLMPLAAARISPLDRGFVFGEGVYEGLRAISWGDGCRVVGIQQHVDRLREGLCEARIEWDPSELHAMSRALVGANGLRDAFVYWQVTGGEPRVEAGDPPRTRVPPGRSGGRDRLAPTVFGYCSAVPALSTINEPMCKRVVTSRDVRWALGACKSISLMGNVWVAKRAAEQGCDEAILIRRPDGALGPRGGIVSEGLATNLVFVFWKIDSAGSEGIEVVTPALESAPMLRGVTRDILLKLSPEMVERTVFADELAGAREAMMVGTTTYVTALTHIDGRAVGPGEPGPVCRELFGRLMRAYREGRY
jgi:D-alanine transaminase